MTNIRRHSSGQPDELHMQRYPGREWRKSPKNTYMSGQPSANPDLWGFNLSVCTGMNSGSAVDGASLIPVVAAPFAPQGLRRRSLHALVPCSKTASPALGFYSFIPSRLSHLPFSPTLLPCLFLLTLFLFPIAISPFLLSLFIFSHNISPFPLTFFPFPLALSPFFIWEQRTANRLSHCIFTRITILCIPFSNIYDLVVDAVTYLQKEKKSSYQPALNPFTPFPVHLPLSLPYYLLPSHSVYTIFPNSRLNGGFQWGIWSGVNGDGERTYSITKPFEWQYPRQTVVFVVI